jgi:hypothetical protein
MLAVRVHCNITEVETTNWSITIRDIAECFFSTSKKVSFKTTTMGPLFRKPALRACPPLPWGGGGEGGGERDSPTAESLTAQT